MIKFVEGQDKTNKLIKELAKTNYDAALQWHYHEQQEVLKRNLQISQTHHKSKPLKAMTMKNEPNPVELLPVFRPVFAA